MGIGRPTAPAAAAAGGNGIAGAGDGRDDMRGVREGRRAACEWGGSAGRWMDGRTAGWAEGMLLLPAEA